MTMFAWASLGVLVLYLAAFFAGSMLAARTAGRSVWLFARATGADALAAFGFKLAFGLALFSPLLLTAFPAIAVLDPFWSPQGLFAGMTGHFIAIAGGMLAFAAQMAMGASWRVGVADDAVGALVTGGLYDLSRNPVFLGQILLLAGVALAIPTVAGGVSVVIFWASANRQIRSEERVLTQSLGQVYSHYLTSVPRWFGLPKARDMKRTVPIQVAGLATLALAVDQISKTVILLVMEPPRVIPVTPFFNLTLGFNEGASFGMLSGLMQGKPWAMIALTGVIIAVVGGWAFRAKTGLQRAGLSLILGGALGNILDRIRQGAVTDFLDFHWAGWHWPTFNMADVAVVTGAMLIFFTAFPRRDKAPARRP